jgi:cold shock CspA family protein
MSHTAHNQGTVATFVEATGSGTVIDDRGYTYEFPPGALAANIRLLRPGQRVRWELEPSGGIGRLSLVTL